MRVTIIKSDNAVIVDGERHTVDCSGLPADFHALQWDGTQGEVEYQVTRCEHCSARSKKGNAIITELEPYNALLDAWRFANLAAKEQAKAEVDIAAEATNAAGPQT